jgi:hypothetical protein
MEVSFTEINNVAGGNNGNVTNNNNVNYLEVKKENNSYWENNVVEVKKKKKVTYDDILTSLNLVVAPNGVLQYMNAKPNTGNDINNQPQVMPQSILKNSVKQEQIQPQVKHSYIYNKYFKSYKDTTVVEEEPIKPMTREEYQKMVIDNLIQKRIAQQRVAQIKSKKMAFTNNNHPIYASRNNLNHLFRF